MLQQFTVAASTHGPSPVLLAVFALGGVVALWAGLSWAFDIRGSTVRRSQRIRQRTADRWGGPERLGTPPANVFGSVGYLRFLGVMLAFAGVVLLVIVYALWQLG
ncbi:hypothetical protein ACIREE_17200 [Streptomyces sp. NPDC102467]|uniref:hypothetical protein n=1 Tax=Streptomyces sp. NPDC102467 TaxID=3366179 RepID=UPI00381E80D5